MLMQKQIVMINSLVLGMGLENQLGHNDSTVQHNQKKTYENQINPINHDQRNHDFDLLYCFSKTRELMECA